MRASRLQPLPRAAAWRHLTSRNGFEVVWITQEETGIEFSGSTSAVEGGESWQIDYRLTVDRAGLTRCAQITSRFTGGSSELELEPAREGEWRANGERVHLGAECLDVDLESSALTNAFPVRRLRLRTGESARAPAVFIRAPALEVELLDQRYERLAAGAPESYRYSAPRFGFEVTLRYDAAGLVTDYPGIAERAL